MNTYICFLDKKNPPDHSFVNGFLIGELSKENRVVLVTERGIGNKPGRYRGVTVLPVLYRRRGIGRFLNIWKVFFLSRLLSLRYGRSYLFIRNDPFFYLGAVLAKGAQRIIYQNSFPHEISSKRYLNIKGAVARACFSYCLPRSDYVIAVTDRAIERLRMYAELPRLTRVIPLKTDFEIVKPTASDSNIGKKVRFIYIGSHSPARRLDFIVESISTLDEKYMDNFVFDLYGGTPSELKHMMAHPSVRSLVDNGCVNFYPAVARPDIEKILSGYDVGVSIIPPTSIYLESSPTKLNEYLSKSLLVLANREIPSQGEVIINCDSCIGVAWSGESIREGFVSILENKEDISAMKEFSYNYALVNSTYSSEYRGFRSDLEVFDF